MKGLKKKGQRGRRVGRRGLQVGRRVGRRGLQVAGWAAVLWLGLLGQGVWAAQTLTNVYTGSAANAGDGDPHRTAYTKINTNMVWLYSLITNPPPDVTNYWRTAATNVLLENPALFNENQFDAGGLGTNIKAGAQFSNIVFKTTYGANGHDFIMQTNIGPGMDVYDYTLGLYTMRWFGDSYGFQFLSQDGTTNWLTLGRNGTAGGVNEKEGILRAYPENTKRIHDTTQGPNLGAGVNGILPELGGSGAALTGQLFGPELWKRLPVPPLQVVTAGDAIFIDPYTNGNNEATYTNVINKFNAANFTRQMAANGIPVWFEVETWMTAARSSGQLQWNNQFPSGGTYMSRYAITNGGLLQLHIDWSAHPGALVKGKFPGTYAAMTPYSAATDVQWGYALGLAGFRLADGQGDNTSHETVNNGGVTVVGSGDVQPAASFSRQAMAKVGYELLYPGGYTPTIMGYTNLMASDCFVFNGYEVSPTMASTIPEHSAWLANITSDDQGRRGGPHSAENIDSALYQGRLTWSNTAWLIGPGHYNSHVYADNRDLSLTDTRAHISMQAMFPGPLWWFGSNITAATSGAFTNLEFAAVFTDRAQQPSFPAFDNGSGLTSAWVKPMSDGGFVVLLANESGISANITLLWSQMVSPSNFIPVGSTLYPFKVNTNDWFFVRDIWAGTDIGAMNATITRTVTAHNIAWLRFTPTTPWNTKFEPTNPDLFMTNQFNIASGPVAGLKIFARDSAIQGVTLHSESTVGHITDILNGGDIANWDLNTGYNWRFPGTVTATNGLILPSGTNKRAGSATLSSGVIVVNNTSVAASDLLFVTPKTPGGTGGTRYKYALSAGTSFTITAVDTSGATVTTDTSTVSWMLVGNP